MSKHLSKEELQSDPFVQHVERATSYFNENRTIILAFFIGIFVVAGAWIGYQYYSDSQEVEAQNLLAIAENFYRQGDYDKALNGDSFELTSGFVDIANRYSGTHAGNLAQYYASVCSYKLGNIEEALDHFSRYDAPKGILGVGAISFHASLLKANGSLEKAAETYLKAAKWDENDSTTPYNLLKAAEIYYELGSYEKASEISNQIIEEYPNSSEVLNAQKLTGMISASL